MSTDWKDRLGIVYSTNPDFQYNKDQQEEPDTLAPSQQRLTVSIDKKQRKGKTVTLISGFIGKSDDLKELGKMLKTKCGSGGTVKDGMIFIQGDFRTKVVEHLTKEGFVVKKSG